MSLNHDLVGTKITSDPYRYTKHDVMLYALGVGCGPDELDFAYEGRGLKVLPTFGVLPPFVFLFDAVARLGFDLERVVHGEQDLEMHAPMPSEGEVRTDARYAAIYDTGRHAVGVIEAKTLTMEGSPLCTTRWTVLGRGMGGWGGDPPPRKEMPKPADGQLADMCFVEKTLPSQALIYRLSGDHNPLHADPGFARTAGFEAPILHGLCTYAFAARAVLRRLDYDLERFGRFRARFTAPVVPGDTLITEGWEVGEGLLAVETRTGSDEVVLTGHASTK